MTVIHYIRWVDDLQSVAQGEDGIMTVFIHVVQCAADNIEDL